VNPLAAKFCTKTKTKTKTKPKTKRTTFFRSDVLLDQEEGNKQ
jgi:hypothetical protein